MSSTHPSRGDIFWADLRPTKGSEQTGPRPVLIVSNNLMNETSSVVLVVPLSTQDEKVSAGPFNVLCKPESITMVDSSVISLETKGVKISTSAERVALCNQARAISKKRLLIEERFGFIHDRKVIEGVNEALVHSFALDACTYCDIPLRPGALICGKCRQPNRRKCSQCHTLYKLSFKFCPHCGKEGL